MSRFLLMMPGASGTDDFGVRFDFEPWRGTLALAVVAVVLVLVWFVQSRKRKG